MSTIIEQTTVNQMDQMDALEAPSSLAHSKRAKRSLVPLFVGALLAVAWCVLATPSFAETRVLYANSLCQYPIRILILHAHDTRAYDAHAWYDFPPYFENRLNAEGTILRQVVGYDLYIYAETVEEAGVPQMTWGGEDATTEFQGVFYSLRKVPLTVNQRGELEFQLTCPE